MLHSGITEIPGTVFNNFTSLQTINLENVQTIRQHGFIGCSSLSGEINLSSADLIDGQAFRSTAISSVIFKDGAVLTGGTFISCTNLTTITLNGSISTGESTFMSCSSLNRINIASLESYMNCDWNNSAGHPFDDNSNGGRLYLNGQEITNFVIPNTITEIKQRAFRRCRFITSITIPNTVTIIGESSFNHTTGIQSLDLPASITSIGNYAFQYMSAMTSFICRAATPPVLSADASVVFGNHNQNLQIYVPASSVNAYKQDSNWGALASIITAIQE